VTGADIPLTCFRLEIGEVSLFSPLFPFPLLPKEVGARLRQLRLEASLTQAEVAHVPAGPALHGDNDSAPKPATLENGMEVLVPQFIKDGDRIKIDVATGHYLERLH